MPTVIQEVMIGEELLVAVRLLKVGLRELHRIDGATDFYHLPILLLASGFERMMKTVICCHHLETTGEFPPSSTFAHGRRGHDLNGLLQRITQDCYSDAYLSRVPAAQTDIAFLRSDPLAKIVKILSDFGQSARYHNLDVVLGHKNAGPSPEDEWQELELEILREDESWARRLGDRRESDAIHREINTALTVQCEKLARALSRLFTIGGGLGPVGMRISERTHHFLFLMDDQLGTTDYERVRV